MRVWIALALATLVLASGAVAGPQKIALGKFHEWDALRDGARKSYTAGGLTLTLVARKRPRDVDMAADDDNRGTLIVTAEDGATTRLAFEGGFRYPKARVAVGTLDPGNAVPQVILQVFTGGAHCCLLQTVFVHRDGGWKSYPVRGGANDEDVEFPKDLDGDGVPDFVVTDDSFAYAFAGFAGCWLPPLVFTMKDGVLVDVSGSRRFDRIYRANIKIAKEGCAPPGANGMCAGYVADAARLGTFRTAWRHMLVNYDRTDRWGWPGGCKHDRPNAVCEPGPENKFRNYPEALAAYLQKLGYISSSDARWAVTESRKPAYQGK